MVVREDDLTVLELISSFKLHHNRNEINQGKNGVLIVVHLAVLDAYQLVTRVISDMQCYFILEHQIDDIIVI